MEMPVSRSKLPTNMTDNTEVLHSYTKTPFRIIPSSGQGVVRSNGVTIFTLPSGKIVDLKTFRIQFLGYTNGTGAENIRFPKFTSSLIQELTITINGQTITIPNYNIVYHAVRDFSPDYKRYVSKTTNNADPSVDTILDKVGVVTTETMHDYDASGLTADANMCCGRKMYVIDDWIGMLGSVEQSFFNTNLVGEFSVSITWANNTVLHRHGATALTPEFYLDKMLGFIDVIEMKDDSYINALESKISSGQISHLPFKHYRLHTGVATVNNKETTMRVTESTNSLDKVHFTYLPNNRTTIAPLQLGVASLFGSVWGDGKVPDANYNYQTLLSLGKINLLNNSQYFRRSGVGLGYNTTRDATATITFAIDGQDVSPAMNLVSVYEETLKANNLNYDNISGANKGISSFEAWQRDFFLATLSTSHVGGIQQGTYCISGIDTQATSLSIEVRVENQKVDTDTYQASLPVIITEMTQVLLVGNGRTVNIQQ